MSVRHPSLRAVLTVVAFVVSFVFSYGPDALEMSLPGALAISVTAAGAVWLSGRWPVAALALAAGLAVGLPVAGATFVVMDLVLVFVVFQVVLRSELPAWLVAAVCLVALTVNDAWLRSAREESWMEPSVLYPALLTALSVGLGLQGRRVRHQHDELVALRELDRRRAVVEERRRIARDLHDVAAHHLSALVVRNRLARRVGGERALDAAAEFTAQTAADALDSMRQVVRLLSAEGDAPLAPSPTLADIDDLVGRMEAAGLRVERVGEVVAPVSDEVEAAVVRIAGEAMANVLRHRGPGRCWLDLERVDGVVTVAVEDDGPATWRAEAADPTWGRAGGHGLVGMRERAEACGGRLVVGPSPRGGWRVAAVLPAVGS